MQPLSFEDVPVPRNGRVHRRSPRSRVWPIIAATVIALLCAGTALGHGVAEGDAQFLQSKAGVHFWAYFYLGAKHMVTGYDHLLFLAGVIFFLYRPREIGLYVTLFAIGHSLTLLAGVWFDIGANPYLVDAIIGLSVVYKAFENIGGFRHLGWHVDTRAAVWCFGLCHGFGLATKLQALSLAEEGLLANLLAFNVGVEAGQLLALAGIMLIMTAWRMSARFPTQALLANAVIMACGFALTGYQLTGYLINSA